MKRLTKTYANGFVTLNAEGFLQSQETVDGEIRNSEVFSAAVMRLKEYEDAEENELIVHLPCKVGDTLYIANKKLNIIFEETVRTFFIGHPSYCRNMPLLQMIRTNKHDIPIDEFCKTVFPTREEAEQALEGGAE